MKYSELKKILKQNGCYKADEGGSHELWLARLQAGSFMLVGTTDKTQGKELTALY